MYRELGIDLGSANVVISSPEKGIVQTLPSVMLAQRSTGKLVGFGTDAMKRYSQSPAEYILERPIKGGISSHLDRAQKMISLSVSDVCGRESVPSRVLFSVPCDINVMEESALVEAAAQAGIAEAYLIYSPLSALIASEMDIASSYMALDIGASRTSIMIVCRGNIVYSTAIDTAGDRFDSAISEYIYSKHNLRVSSFTAESIKKRIGTVWGDDSPIRNVEVRAKRSDDGTFSAVRLASDEMFTALEEPTASLIEVICSTIARIPTQYVNEVFSHGILLYGGGSMLSGLAKIISGITGVDTYVFPSAPEAVALGLSEVLKILPKRIAPSIKNVSKFAMKSLGGYNIV